MIQGPEKVPSPAPFCFHLGSSPAGEQRSVIQVQPWSIVMTHHTELRPFLRGRERRAHEIFSLRGLWGPHLIGRGLWDTS